jgi:N-acetylglucosaminyl-diphospho-decaprenol L-rhamnosyltransferase
VIYFLTVNYYSTNLVAQLINSLSCTNTQYQTVIINNSPEDDSIHNLQSESVLIIDAGSNLGFGNACNVGIKWIYTQDTQAIIWIINPDAYLPKNTLDINGFFKLHPEISILGTIIHTPTGEIWFAGGRFIRATGSILTQDMLKNTDAEYVVCDWVSGCSLIINLANFRECPLFNSAYFLYYEDFEFCRRYANEGYLVAITKQFGVLHQPSSITNRNIFLKNKYSTYSYLLTLEKYTNKLVFVARSIRLICYALLLMFVKPHIGLGKLYGVLIYWRR